MMYPSQLDSKLLYYNYYVALCNCLVSFNCFQQPSKLSCVLVQCTGIQVSASCQMNFSCERSSISNREFHLCIYYKRHECGEPFELNCRQFLGCSASVTIISQFFQNHTAASHLVRLAKIPKKANLL